MDVSSVPPFLSVLLEEKETQTYCRDIIIVILILRLCGTMASSLVLGVLLVLILAPMVFAISPVGAPVGAPHHAPPVGSPGPSTPFLKSPTPSPSSPPAHSPGPSPQIKSGPVPSPITSPPSTPTGAPTPGTPGTSGVGTVLPPSMTISISIAIVYCMAVAAL